MPTLTWLRAVDHPELLAASTFRTIRTWAAAQPRVADEVLVAEIDPDLADTAAMTAAYGLSLAESVNCVLVAGRRAGEEKVAAAAVRATTRADVNNAVKRLLDVRKASFLAMDRAVQESGMEYGGITPVGLPSDWPVWVDGAVADTELVCIGAGIRGAKLLLAGADLLKLPTAERVDHLARGIAG